MPNWTFNTFEAPKKVIAKYLDEQGNFDFNKVIKMPETLNIESGGMTDGCIVVYFLEKMTLDLKDLKKKDLKLLNTLVNNMFAKNWAKEVVKSIKNANYDENKLQEMYDKGKIYVNNYLQYGATTWYDWCNTNWGTKWNACDTMLDSDFDSKKKSDMTFVQFSTAWCMPYMVMKKVFEDNLNCKLNIKWFDEDYNGDHYIKRFKNGNYKSDIEGFIS